MTNTSIENTKNKLAQFYALGILAFTALVGTLTLVVVFVSHLNTN